MRDLQPSTEVLDAKIIAPTPLRPIRPPSNAEHPQLLPPVIATNVLLGTALQLPTCKQEHTSLSGVFSDSQSRDCSSPVFLLELDGEDSSSLSKVPSSYFQYFAAHGCWPIPESRPATPTNYDYTSTTYMLWPD